MNGNDVDIETLLALSASADPFRTSGVSQGRDAGWLYGGQLLGQAVAAAGRTVSNKQPHSMHAYFLAPGRFDRSVDYVVEDVRDGRSFANRRVEAFQSTDDPILHASVSFHTPETGASHQRDAPPRIPAPESLDPAYGSTYRSGLESSFDIRRIPADLLSDSDTARRGVWLRATSPASDDPLFHAAALAYLSDFELFLPALLRHDLLGDGVMATSLDHALWWHVPARVDEWLLYIQESPRTSGSRGIAYGHFYTLDGTLVASSVQEGLMRVRAPA